MLTEDDVCLANETKIDLKVKGHQLLTTSSVPHGTYSYQVTSISDQ